MLVSKRWLETNLHLFNTTQAKIEKWKFLVFIIIRGGKVVLTLTILARIMIDHWYVLEQVCSGPHFSTGNDGCCANLFELFQTFWLSINQMFLEQRDKMQLRGYFSACRGPYMSRQPRQFSMLPRQLVKWKIVLSFDCNYRCYNAAIFN